MKTENQKITCWDYEVCSLLLFYSFLSGGHVRRCCLSQDFNPICFLCSWFVGVHLTSNA